MWIFTEDSFLSVVRHWDFPERLLVRARIREDLVRFCRLAGVDESGIHENPLFDYRFRVEVPEETFIHFMVKAIKLLDYGNFKDRACDNPDDPPRVREKRDRVYHQIWALLRSLQRAACKAREACL